MKEKKIVIIGGGTAGLSVAHGLARRLSPEQITIVEPNKDHLYQPWWTLVGGGIVEKEDSRRPMTELLKKGIHWVQDFADSFDPQNNKVITKDGTVLDYDYLVVAPGIQSNWHLIDGLTETLGKNGVCSNYSYDSVDSTW
ncbi:MAG: FAD-dependent oxidoreductase, partial [Bdellovibrionales bacterium]|nr:FAD-dependent oxidoreductase [Bdellovibrionales bacterium]